MQDILVRLRADAGQLTLGVLIQEREAAACEIEQLRGQLRQQRSTAEAAPRTSRPTKAVMPSTPPVRPRTSHPNALLRLADVRSLVGISRSTIYKRISEGSFPSPVRISERSVRWRLEDIEEWIREPARALS
jgi:prophage regulatory protein